MCPWSHCCDLRSGIRLGKVPATPELFRPESPHAPLPQPITPGFVSPKYCVIWNYLVPLFTYYFSSSSLWNGNYKDARTSVLISTSSDLGVDRGTPYRFVECIIYPYKETKYFGLYLTALHFSTFLATQSHFANFPEMPCFRAVAITLLPPGLWTYSTLCLEMFLPQTALIGLSPLTSFRFLLKQHAIREALSLYFSL